MTEPAAALDEAPLQLLFLGEDSVEVSRFIETMEKLELRADVHHLADQSLLTEALERLKPDLVLVDFGVTESSRRTYIPGLVMRKLKEQAVVAVTATEREYRGIAAVQLGAHDYICVDPPRLQDIKSVISLASRRRDFFARLSQHENSVRSILHSINDGVIVVDRDGVVISLNPAARSILGLGSRESPGTEWCQTFASYSAEDGAPLLPAERPLARALDGGKFSAVDVMHRAPGQPDLILSISGQGLVCDDGLLIGAVLSFRDSTEHYRKSVELERLSSYDTLTGLANRRLLEDYLEKACGRSRRTKRAVSVLFIDLDRFKSVNDTLGHDVGDALLIEVANRLSGELRIGDFIARWGGDEFVVVLENSGSPRDAAAVAQKLCIALAEKYAPHDTEVYVTPSIGIAQFPTCGDTAEALIKAADAAMYQAKRRGGGRFHFYTEGLNKQQSEHNELEIGLRHALVRREFVLHYQPRIDGPSGRLIGLEALLRWQHPRYGLLPPARFLALLETSGLIFSVGEWVIDEACRQLKAWQDRYNQPDLSITVNLSPHQLARGRLVDVVARAVANTALDPGCLELEVGEAALSERRDGPMETLTGLRNLGVRLSVDHFGTRDISFRTFDRGVVDTFVLHKSLIRDIEKNSNHQRIVRATIAMARGLDIEVGAEGVETNGQLEFLQNCRCNILQGFLISRPMRADAIAKMLGDRNSSVSA